jgi:hypothetical protein
VGAAVKLRVTFILLGLAGLASLAVAAMPHGLARALFVAVAAYFLLPIGIVWHARFTVWLRTRR